MEYFLRLTSAVHTMVSAEPRVVASSFADLKTLTCRKGEWLLGISRPGQYIAGFRSQILRPEVKVNHA